MTGRIESLRALSDQTDGLARSVTVRHFARHPDLEDRFGDRGRRKCFEDTRFHLQHLTSALRADRPQLFAEYLSWAASVLAAYDISVTDLQQHLQTIRDVLRERLGGDLRSAASQILDVGVERLAGQTPDPAPELVPEAPQGQLATEYLDLLLGGDRRGALELIAAKSDAIGVRDLYLHVFQPVLREVGRRWQLREVSVAQEHLVTAATQLAMAQLYPRLFSTPRNGRTLVAMCVGDELHEVGMRMVADLLELEGWTSHFLGANTPPRAAAETVREQAADLVAVSVTMMSHVEQATETITAIRAGTDAPIIVGGRAVLLIPDLWRELGADGTARDAGRAATAATELLDRSGHGG
ncbi:MAG: cobalamin-dependent protein [Nitriliruptorales bacterium]|nr:cobalamin-dependent protein [Nitriliruptorales bacterium]